MSIDKAKAVFNIIKPLVQESKYFQGIEIAVLKKGEEYTSDVCVRIAVNQNNITHKDLNIPENIDGIEIIIIYRIIKPL